MTQVHTWREEKVEMAKSSRARERSCCWADRRGRALVGVGERERQTGDTPSLGEPVAADRGPLLVRGEAGE